MAVSRSDDPKLYREAYEEAQRIIRISDEVRISLEKIAPKVEKGKTKKPKIEVQHSKLTTSKLAKKLEKTTSQLLEELISKGYLKIDNEKEMLTEKGKQVGGESKKGRFGAYFLWDDDFTI